MSSSKKLAYFFNTDTKESSWDPPAGLSESQISSLPGAELLNPATAHAGQVRASHLLIKHRDSRRPASWKEVRNTIPFYDVNVSELYTVEHYAHKGGSD
jgi:NIMA-interacting peptidyl-prolyl cis-trans isomerase 1